ncbi:ABC transporter substrate-binding protein [Streptomyces sp. AM 4-1-1]|uniref:ABC transporter substrate-binding protein n=1 Tax=Streptomyces sp. AM 4-1-1 TaxID=3028710 RepID=UPI0023B8DD18|nr:ABC transporter substrate-binding protein [Streptomyces sp. AM 4-1-1]WEH35880.1 ABC transporter substrate-binding protein [Streptomyces sp. AM 4-1-1]
MFRSRAVASSAARAQGSPLPRIRRAAACLVAAVAVTLTASCGTTTDSGTTSSKKDAASQERTVETPDGPVKIPTAPKRIIGLSYASAWLLDAGVPMVGVTDIDEDALTSDQKTAVKKMTIVGEGNELNFEKIASLHPDLIVISSPKHVPFNIGKLKPIAPVLSYPIAKPVDLLPSSLKVIDAAGEGGKGTAFKKAYDDKVAELRSTYADKLARTDWAVVNSGEAGKYSVYTETSWLGAVVKDIGARFVTVPGAPKGEFTYDLSFEEIGKLKDADVILVDGDGKNGEPVAETKSLMAQQNWAALQAAKNKQVHAVPGFFVSRYPEAMKILTQLETVLKSL